MKKGSVAVKKRAQPELQDIDKRVPLAEFLERPEIKALEHGSKSDAFLRRECEFRGVQPSSNRALMEQRLQLFYAGEQVVTAELRKQVRLTTDMIVTTGDQHHQLAPVYARGDMQLLGLPHSVIREHLLPHLTNVDDLFAMLYVCKYVHDDVLVVLRKRAQQELGAPAPADGEPQAAATPMALSAIRHWERWFSRQLHHTLSIYRRLTLAQRAHRYRSTIVKLQYAMRNAGFSRVYLGSGQLDAGSSSQCIRDAVMATITAHGSVEGLVRERQRQRDLLLCKRTETEALLQDAPARAQGALAALTEVGCPPFFTYTAGDGFEYLPLAKVIWQLLDASSKPRKFIQSIRPHICRENPKQLRVHPDAKLSATVTRILTWASHVGTGSCGIHTLRLSLVKAMFLNTDLRLCNIDLTDNQLAIQLNACILSPCMLNVGYSRNVAIWGTDLNQQPFLECVYQWRHIGTMFDLCHRYGLTRFSSVRVTYVSIRGIDVTEVYELRDAPSFVVQAVFPNVDISLYSWIAIELLSNTHFIPL